MAGPLNTSVQIIPEITGEEQLRLHLTHGVDHLGLFHSENGTQFGLRFVPEENTLFYFQLNRALNMLPNEIRFIESVVPQVRIEDLGKAQRMGRFNASTGEYNTRSYDRNTVFNELSKDTATLRQMCRAATPGFFTPIDNKEKLSQQTTFTPSSQLKK